MAKESKQKTGKTIITAEQFIKELKKIQSAAELKKYERYFPVEKRNGDNFIGVKMGNVFSFLNIFYNFNLLSSIILLIFVTKKY